MNDGVTQGTDDHGLDIGPIEDEIRELLAPGGTLRAGINLSNFLLVTSRAADGTPQGVSPDMARTLANLIGAKLEYVPYPSPGPLADDAGSGNWDVGLIGAEPQRAEFIAFTPAYSEIEASYLLPPGSTLANVEEVDRPGVRIATTARTAYGLWLERNIRHATFVWGKTFDEALETLREGRADALGALRAGLLKDRERFPGATIMPGRFMAVRQAIGTPRARERALPLLERFVAQAVSTGLVARLIEKHGAEGLAAARE